MCARYPPGDIAADVNPRLTAPPPTAGSSFASPVSRPAIVHPGKRVLAETESEAPTRPPNPASLFLLVKRPSLRVSQKNREDQHVVTRGSYFEGAASMAPGGGSEVATRRGARWASFPSGEPRTQPFKLSRWRLRRCGAGSGSCMTRPQRRG